MRWIILLSITYNTKLWWVLEGAGVIQEEEEETSLRVTRDHWAGHNKLWDGLCCGIWLLSASLFPFPQQMFPFLVPRWKLNRMVGWGAVWGWIWKICASLCKSLCSVIYDGCVLFNSTRGISAERVLVFSLLWQLNADTALAVVAWHCLPFGCSFSDCCDC